jgi:hypothetical protein
MVIGLHDTGRLPTNPAGSLAAWLRTDIAGYPRPGKLVASRGVDAPEANAGAMNFEGVASMRLACLVRLAAIAP